MTGQKNGEGDGLVLADHLAWRQVDDEVVALDIESSRYMSLNESAAMLWNAMANGATREALVQLLADTYGIDTKAAERDVDDFLSQCRQRSLVRS